MLFEQTVRKSPNRPDLEPSKVPIGTGTLNPNGDTDGGKPPATTLANSKSYSDPNGGANTHAWTSK